MAPIPDLPIESIAFAARFVQRLLASQAEAAALGPCRAPMSAIAAAPG